MIGVPLHVVGLALFGFLNVRLYVVGLALLMAPYATSVGLTFGGSG
jgi:hypothetical protein